MLKLHRLPPFLRVLYTGIAVFWVLALGTHWLRLALRHGAGPARVQEWYLGNDADEAAETILFARPWLEVTDDSWHNLLHHTLALLVLAGLLVRTDVGHRTMGLVAGGMALSIPATVLGPILVRWQVTGAAHAYVGGLALLNLIAIGVAGLVLRDVFLRGGRSPRGAQRSAVIGAVTILSLVLGTPVAAQDTQRLATESEGLSEAFPTASRFQQDTVRVDPALRTHLEAELGRPIFDLFFEITRAYSEADSLLGYALVTDEQGKYRPITMLVAVNPDGSVRDVSILVYRESRGGEVARERFLRQYRGRSGRDPIRINRDIINISGATISVISVNQGVRKAIALIERVYQ